MKRNLVLIAGALVWLVIGCSIVLERDSNHQKALAAQVNSQTQTVKQLEGTVQTQLATSKQQVSTLETVKNQLCTYGLNAQAALVKYKVNLPLPVSCE